MRILLVATVLAALAMVPVTLWFTWRPAEARPTTNIIYLAPAPLVQPAIYTWPI
jgi:hypothetical protein